MLQFAGLSVLTAGIRQACGLEDKVGPWAVGPSMHQKHFSTSTHEQGSVRSATRQVAEDWLLEETHNRGSASQPTDLSIQPVVPQSTYLSSGWPSARPAGHSCGPPDTHPRSQPRAGGIARWGSSLPAGPAHGVGAWPLSSPSLSRLAPVTS